MSTVNPRISSRGLICKNEFLGGGLFDGGGGLFEGGLIRGGGLISKFSIFLKGRHKNEIVFVTNLTKN